MNITTKDEKEVSKATFEETNSDFLYYDEAVKINSEVAGNVKAPGGLIV